MGRTISFPIGLFLYTLIVPIGAQEQPPAPPDTKVYTLEAKYAPGDLLKYGVRMQMTMDMKTAKGETPPLPGPMEGASNMVMHMKTAGVKPDGTGVIVVKILSGQFSMMGSSANFPSMPPFTLEVNRLGKVVKVRDLPALPGGPMLSQFMNFDNMPGMGVVLPDHPVKVGESWITEIPFPMSADQKIKIVSTLLGAESINHQPTLKIKQEMSIPFNIKMGQDGKPTTNDDEAFMSMLGQMTASGTSHILESNARVVRAVYEGGGKIEMTGKAFPVEQTGGSITMNMTMKMNMDLISAGKVAPTASIHKAPLKKPGVQRKRR